MCRKKIQASSSNCESEYSSFSRICPALKDYLKPFYSDILLRIFPLLETKTMGIRNQKATLKQMKFDPILVLAILDFGHVFIIWIAKR